MEGLRRQKAAVNSVIALPQIERDEPPSTSSLVQELRSHVLVYYEVSWKLAEERKLSEKVAMQKQLLQEQYDDLRTLPRRQFLGSVKSLRTMLEEKDKDLLCNSSRRREIGREKMRP